mgnify:CR=1 FL=1
MLHTKAIDFGVRVVIFCMPIAMLLVLRKIMLREMPKQARMTTRALELADAWGDFLVESATLRNCIATYRATDTKVVDFEKM